MLARKIHETAARIVEMSERGQITLTAVEIILAEFVAHGVVDHIEAAIAAAQTKPTTH